MITLDLELLIENTEDLVELDLPMVNYVNKHIDRFIYSPFVRKDAIPVAYIENKKITSTDNLNIIDKSWNVAANRVVQDFIREPYLVIRSNAFTSVYKDILVTNQSVVNNQNKVVPLFFAHYLPEDATSCQLEIIHNGNFLPVEETYKIDLANKRVYLNCKNWFDEKTNSYTLYFLTGATSSGNYRQLLNPQEVVKEAGWEDIDQVTGQLLTNRPLYSKDVSGDYYHFSFNMNDVWYIKNTEYSKIKPLAPAAKNLKESWFFRVSNGFFSDLANGYVRNYKLPEFLQQNFAPFAPLRYSTYTSVNKINDYTFQLAKGNLKISLVDNLHLELKVYSAENILLKAITTNSSLEGERYRDTNVFYESGIVSWDESTGIFVLDKKIDDSYSMNASHFFSSKELEYTGIDLNPLYNREIQNHTVVFYLIPDTTDRALHYLLVDRSGLIVYTSQDLGTDYPSLKLMYENAVNPNSVIGLPYTADEDDSFLSLYSAGGSNDYAYLILAEINYMNTSIPENHLSFDLQRKGLSIEKNKLMQVMRKNPKILQSILGYGKDGQELPFNGSMVFDVPITLLQEYGGDLDKQEVETLIKAHFPAYAAGIIRWDYPIVQLDATSTTDGEILLTWDWEGPAYEYLLYKKNNYSGEWVLYGTYDSESPIMFNITDTDIEDGGVYYYAVAVKEGDLIYPLSNSVGIKAEGVYVPPVDPEEPGEEDPLPEGPDPEDPEYCEVITALNDLGEPVQWWDARRDEGGYQIEIGDDLIVNFGTYTEDDMIIASDSGDPGDIPWNDAIGVNGYAYYGPSFAPNGYPGYYEYDTPDRTFGDYTHFFFIPLVGSSEGTTYFRRVTAFPPYSIELDVDALILLNELKLSAGPADSGLLVIEGPDWSTTVDIGLGTVDGNNNGGFAIVVLRKVGTTLRISGSVSAFDDTWTDFEEIVITGVPETMVTQPTFFGGEGVFETSYEGQWEGYLGITTMWDRCFNDSELCSLMNYAKQIDNGWIAL